MGTHGVCRFYELYLSSRSSFVSKSTTSIPFVEGRCRFGLRSLPLHRLKLLVRFPDDALQVRPIVPGEGARDGIPVALCFSLPGSSSRNRMSPQRLTSSKGASPPALRPLAESRPRVRRIQIQSINNLLVDFQRGKKRDFSVKCVKTAIRLLCLRAVASKAV